MKPVRYAVEHTRVEVHLRILLLLAAAPRRAEGRDLTRDILSSHLDATPFLPFVRSRRRREDARTRHFSAVSFSLFRFIYSYF